MTKKALNLTLSILLAAALAACSPAPDPVEKPGSGDPLAPGSTVTEQTPPEQTPPDSQAKPDDTVTTPENPPAGTAPENPPATSTAPDQSKPADTPSAPPQGGTTAPSQPPAPPQGDPDPAPPAGTAPDGGFTIDDIWTGIAAALGDSLPELSSLDAETLTILYPLSAGDLTEFGFYGSLMNVKASEFFIARVESGKMDAVKEAVMTRQSDLEIQWKPYLPDQYELVQNYRLVENGDYLFFGIAENIDDAVAVFNEYTQ